MPRLRQRTGTDQVIAVTLGEPAGIGPEVALRAAAAAGVDCELIGDAALMESTARALGMPWPLLDTAGHRVGVHHVPLNAPVRPGELDVRNGAGVLATLDASIQGWRDGRYSGVATAPVHKALINQAGFAFSGHTEYFAQATGAAREVMMLVGGGLRVALVTTHLPLASVPAAITRSAVESCIDVVDRDLRQRFGMAAPRIAVLGLNPHAGEGGYLGREEIDTISPAIKACVGRGVDATGPWPADTAFVPRHAQHFDAIVAMYHDQGLATLKYASFGGGVNVTLGMPIIRTSADHGTALDLAGRGTADAGSMTEALILAHRLAQSGAAS